MSKSKLSYMIDEELLIKIKFIAYEKKIPLNTLLHSFVTKYIENYENLNGTITPEQINKTIKKEG
ncbi:hypothetical protein [Fusobacterium sp.]|uniref:hypothetical protein n=1 Tax=Fusobacterium sp. TaxID=68766 RepID=UPI00261D5E96|nr:hypothetical protein [Fusobacterium sp.]